MAETAGVDDALQRYAEAALDMLSESWAASSDAAGAAIFVAALSDPLRRALAMETLLKEAWKRGALEGFSNGRALRGRQG